MKANFLMRTAFVLNLFLNLSCLLHAQKCSHKPALITPKTRIHMEKPKTTQARIFTPDQRMKFHVHYDQSVLDLDVAAEIQDVVAEVVEHVSRTLSVKQDPGFFLIPKQCVVYNQTVNIDGQEYCTVSSCYAAACGEVLVPENLSQPCFDCEDDGTNCIEFGGTTQEASALTEAVHYTLFVGSLTSSCEERVLAYASACFIDATTDRPLAGFMNICPIGLDLDRERLLSLVQHEIFHALGFTQSLYGLYRDADGNPLTPREANGFPPIDPETGLFMASDRVIQELTLDWDFKDGTTQRPVKAFVTPNIVREARAHFGCPSLMGVEIEDGGGVGTALSHFEKRILATESMNGFIAPVRAFSRISLALMEDTGWYLPDYDQADKLNWGKDLGCDFVQKSCKYWIDTKMNAGLPIAPWCNVPFETSCHAEGVDVAYCTFYTYSTGVPFIFQVFTEIDNVDPGDVQYYGGDELSDYCPYHSVDFSVPRNQTVNDLYCTNKDIINDCRVSDCMNGGVCRDVISGYYCDCPVGYAGALCDHVNMECTMNSDCQLNEVCTSNQCVCERDRIRDENDKCIGVSEVKEYSMTLTVSEVNGQPAVYDPSLMGAAGEQFRNGIEYEIRQIIGNDASLSVALVNVVTRNISAGSIVVDLGLIFLENSSDSSTNITLASVVAATTTQENILRESGTAYTIAWNASGVQDANECEDAGGNDCSPYAQCTNTDGSYECACLPGYDDASRTGVPPGRNCTEINECSPNQCMNGANCTDLVNSYRCVCPSGFQGVNCETDFNDCSPNPCLNGATCTDRINGYDCMCADGYIGDNCETDFNDCSPDPCLNGATCTDRINGYDCMCADGYIGDNCETDFNDCSPDPCLNGATCTDRINGYDCMCADGYIGDNCETDFNDCSPNPCLNGATCTDRINGYNCMCAVGYIGDNCETDANECEDAGGNDCSPYAQCTNTDGSYECACIPGYDDASRTGVPPGRNCTEINECSPNQCMNGANCTDLVNSYRCACPSGFQGVNCETDFNDCSPDPCLNGATCTDRINGYDCMCADGYIGENCETDFNDCSPNPCLNGATCTDRINGYNCMCAVGYIGDNCETDEDECLTSPCQNGATCNSLGNRYLCECPDGYSGNRCQIAPVMCARDDSCGELQICNSEGMCECGPNYVENDNGQCEVAYFFEITLTITSLNGGLIIFSVELTDVTSAEYIRLATILRRLLLLKVRILRRLARIFFRNGSVVAVFEGGVGEPMSANDLQQIITSDLGNGNITSGGSSIGVDPASLDATDVNECSTVSDNDCSPNADCTNEEGSFNCSCRSGFTDESPLAGRPGRVCTSGLSTGAIVALSVGLGIVFILFLLIMCTACLFMQRRANLIYQEQYFRSRRHRSREDRRDGGRNFKTVDRDFVNPYGSYGAARLSPLAALYGDDRGKENWFLRDSRGQMDSPFASRGPDYYMPPPRGNHSQTSRNQRPQRFSASPVGNYQPPRRDYEEPLPPYSRRYLPDADDEFDRPYYVSREALY